MLDRTVSTTRFRCLLVMGVVVVVAGCSGAGSQNSVPASTQPTTPTAISSVTTTTSVTPPGDSAPSTVPELVKREVVLALPVVSQFGPEWTEQFVIRYGEADHQLGLSRSGDGTAPGRLGPEFGTQSPDGSWWFLDVAKARLAHYSTNGEYLGAVLLSEEVLANGRYVPYQLPHTLGDGTLVLSWMDVPSSKLLLVEDGSLRLVDVEGMFSPFHHDGKLLYGFSEDGERIEVDPRTGQWTVVEWFRAHGGSRFRVQIRDDTGTISLPDASVPLEIAVRVVDARDEGERVLAAVEHESGADGTLFFYMFGGSFMGGGDQLAGFFAIGPDGAITEIETTPHPYSSVSPASGAHLVVRPGTSVPSLVFVDDDGVRVYTREASRS